MRRAAALLAAGGLLLLPAWRATPWEIVPPASAIRTGVITDTSLGESSGVAVRSGAPGGLWSLNDSGNPPLLFALDTAGVITGRYRVDAPNIDWEDLAAGPCPGLGVRCLYLADTGDNPETRTAVAVHRLVEPASPPPTDAPLAVQTLRLHYPDGPADVEAVFVDGHGRLHLVTKGRSRGVRHYRVPAEAWAAGEAVAELVATLPLDATASLADRVTGAALAPDGKRVVVRTYATLHLFRLSADGRLTPLGTPPRGCTVAGLEPQGEAVAWLDGQRLVLTSERFTMFPGPIHVVECPVP